MASFLSDLLLLVFLVFSSSFLSCSSRNRKELRIKTMKPEMEAVPSRPVHSGRVDPSRVVELSWQPRTFIYEGFLSREECDQLIALAQKMSGKSSTDGNGSGGTATEVKLERSGHHELVEDEIVSRIEERISAWTFLPKEYGKVLKAMRYGNEESEEKLDYFGNRSSLEEREDEIHPVIATVILYLSNVNHGGQILFPSSEAKGDIGSNCTETSNILRPTKGNALLFFSRYHNSTPDYSSTHARCPVRKREMWVATKLFRIKVRGQEKVEHSSDDYLCSDQDTNCGKWAAMGECQKNPAFMVGSDDYLGTCRFSCKVC